MQWSSVSRLGILRAGLVAVLPLAQHAVATNGYFTHGIGTHNKALAGAGVASPEHAIDAANNFAAGVLVADRTEIGFALFSPKREYTPGPSQLDGQFGAFTLGEGTVESDSNWFPIPYVAKNWHLDEGRAITALFYGRGGMNTNYKSGSATFDPDGPGPAPVMTLPGTYGDGNTGVNLNQAFIEIGYSFKLGDFAIGLAPVIVLQAFEVEGLGTFAPYTATFAASGGTQMPDSLSSNGLDYSWGYGIKGGVIWDVSERLNLSLSYQSKTQMEKFDKYSDLFANGGSFDIPAVTRIGASLRVSDSVTLHGDVEHAEYGDVASIANDFRLVFNCPTAGAGGSNVANCFGGSEGAGFSWSDVTTYKIGVTWDVPESPFSVRAGFNYGENPLDDDASVVNILAPATVERHFTFGIARKTRNGGEADVAFMFAPEVTNTGRSAFDPTQRIDVTMSQFEVEFSYAW
jgi:long-chain fatty acid transport protein